MKLYNITAYPYAMQRGFLRIPDTVSEDEMDEYIKKHWDGIEFEEPELDYAGTDFEKVRIK